MRTAKLKIKGLLSGDRFYVGIQDWVSKARDRLDYRQSIVNTQIVMDKEMLVKIPFGKPFAVRVMNIDYLPFQFVGIANEDLTLYITRVEDRNYNNV